MLSNEVTSQRMPTITWHMITPEYPPNCGGVSDYSEHIAHGLRAAGDEVHVWCPASDAPNSGWVHHIPGGMSVKGLQQLGDALDQFPKPRRLLVQWVPHGYGYNSMNLPFCIWLWWRARRGDRVEIMVHEAFLFFLEGNWKQDAAALVHRVMIIILLQAASQVWMSTSSWEKHLKRYTLGRKTAFDWLPVPTTIPVISQPAGAPALRERFAPPGTKLIGHFGTYGKNVAPVLARIVLGLLSARSDLVLLLMGRSSDAFRERLIGINPELASRIVASGHVDPESISHCLTVCDLLVQPFVDGANARRTSLVAGLAHGAAIVTTLGPRTEPFWKTSNAVILVPVDREDLYIPEIERLLGDPAELSRLRRGSRGLYEQYFDVELVVQMLRRPVVPRADAKIEALPLS
jgi:glycosyltransferase involved in cell wall biosynthesis